MNTVDGIIGPLTLQVDPESHAVSQADAVTRDARECDKLRQTEACHGVIVKVLGTAVESGHARMERVARDGEDDLLTQGTTKNNESNHQKGASYMMALSGRPQKPCASIWSGAPWVMCL